MAEYIEREAVVDYINKISEETDNWYEESAPENPLNMLEHFKSVPAADVVEVRYGVWKYNDGYNTCSVCRNEVAETDDCGRRQWFDYCPNCAAKMDGATDTNVGCKMDGKVG